ncbi:MAG TPA: hypothetical protein VMV27_05765 [Candidatus Binataceae bacterium]|nr:hypothetical protein [Candidatus Binataceae bacterium]
MTEESSKARNPPRYGLRRGAVVKIISGETTMGTDTMETFRPGVVFALARAATAAILAGALAIELTGCGVASAPIAHTPQVVATPLPGQLTVSVQAAPSVGEVQPVFVSVANGTDDPRAVVPSQVFALNSSGERIAPLPAGEAARQAGGAKELSGALGSAALAGAAGGAVGAGLGALAGAGFGAVGPGALVGTAIGAGEGMFSGVQAGQSKADQQANQQLSAVALKQQDVNRNFTVSGYVFFPKGDYQQVQMLLVDKETGDTQTITEPWR